MDSQPSSAKMTDPVVQMGIHVPEELPLEEHESPVLEDEGRGRGRTRLESIESYAEPTTSDEETQQFPAARREASVQSRAVSVKVVPRSERAGLLGRFAILYEAEEPRNYPRKIKWFITLWIALAAVTAPMGSSIILRMSRDPSKLPF